MNKIWKLLFQVMRVWKWLFSPVWLQNMLLEKEWGEFRTLYIGSSINCPQVSTGTVNNNLHYIF
jgi:hypothetical protein